MAPRPFFSVTPKQAKIKIVRTETSKLKPIYFSLKNWAHLPLFSLWDSTKQFVGEVLGGNRLTGGGAARGLQKKHFPDNYLFGREIRTRSMFRWECCAPYLAQADRWVKSLWIFIRQKLGYIFCSSNPIDIGPMSVKVLEHLCCTILTKLRPASAQLFWRWFVPCLGIRRLDAHGISYRHWSNKFFDICVQS